MRVHTCMHVNSTKNLGYIYISFFFFLMLLEIILVRFDYVFMLLNLVFMAFYMMIGNGFVNTVGLSNSLGLS